MLKRLKYDVKFPKTGKHLSNDISFQEGYGVITGANEAGKSFTIEMVRWLLFGTAALRGKAEDYKTLSGSMWFDVNGETYHVQRTNRTAILHKGVEVIVVGVTPVNQKVAHILGFGLAVFDIACVANQGSLEALGAMKPTERRRMVDSVIGLAIIEDLAKQAGDEARSLNRSIRDLKSSYREPVCPPHPDGYLPPMQIKEALTARALLVQKVTTMKSTLAIKPVAVVKPVDPAPQFSIPELTQKVEDLKAMERLKARIDSLSDLLPDQDLEALTQMETDWDLFNLQQRYPKPKLDLIEIEAMRLAWGGHEKYMHQLLLEFRKIEIQKGKQFTCPECDHTWLEHDEELKLIEKALETPVPPVKKPVFSMLQLDHMVAQIETRMQFVSHEVEQPELTQMEILKAKKQIEDYNEKTILIQQYSVLPDYRTILGNKIRYEKDIQQYDILKNEYEILMQKRGELKSRLEELNKAILKTEHLQELLTACLVFDSMLIKYEEELIQKDEYKEKINIWEEEAIQWDRACQALTNLRGLVKQHLVPSLNKVSSQLINLMTNGGRKEIIITEDFDITVDGQNLDTLSGSGKAVANLAIRIGLGQVLTNNVFSLFVGDEIDASMDAERAKNTSKTLWMLKEHISQILLITHKFPSADYHITVGEEEDEPESTD